jgi:hypothetical protein
MFQFAGFASPSYGFRRRSPLREGLPHSEIPGSPIARISPGLFAACHVLHRLSVPRHPPDALCFALDHRIASRRCRTTAAHRAKPRRRPRMKTLLSDTPGASAAGATPTGEALLRRTGHAVLASGLSASVTPQLSVHPSINPPPRSPAAVSRDLLRTSPQPHGTGRPAKPGVAGGGGERIRTDDLLLAKQALSQLSYTPVSGVVGQEWWAREDLNLRPHAYQARALTS